MVRIPLIDYATASPRQRAVWDRIAAGPRGKVGGPFPIALHSPEMADRLQELGAFLRYDSSLEPLLSEWTILIVANHWQCRHELSSHTPIALAAGVPEAAIAALASRDRPDVEDPRMAAIFDFATELLELHKVRDVTYDRALALLGEVGLVDLTAIIGYYSALAMLLNAHGDHD